jgi:HSP20 family protein
MDRGGVIRYYQLEVYYGPFERTIPIPPEIKIDREMLQAKYRDGFLIITLPKRIETETLNVPIE